MQCKLCKNKIDGFAYRLNDGDYCENCYKVGLVIQRQRLNLYNLREFVEYGLRRL